jgi:hypothetical protein
MKANEKAKELVSKFEYTQIGYTNIVAKNCALVVVDEVLKTYPAINGVALYKNHIEDVMYWNEVKEEISKL